MKISLTYVPHALSALLLILFGYSIVMMSYPHIPLSADGTPEPRAIEGLVVIASGIAALVRPWNILISTWFYLLGTLSFQSGFLTDVWSELIEWDLEVSIFLTWVLVGLLLALFARARTTVQAKDGAHIRGAAAGIMGALLIFVAGYLFYDIAMLLRGFEGYPASIYVPNFIFRALIICALALTMMNFLRGRSFFLANFLAFVAGSAFWKFNDVFYVLWWGQPLADQIPHRLGNTYDYLPYAIAFVACLAGLALIAFATQQSRVSTAPST